MSVRALPRQVKGSSVKHRERADCADAAQDEVADSAESETDVSDEPVAATDEAQDGDTPKE